MNSTVSVILPCLNERDNIGPLLMRLMAALPGPREFIVVDDDSTDGTGAIVARLAEKFPEIRLVTRRGERGLPSALRKGITEANGGIVAWMDCDLSMPPEKLSALVAAVRSGTFDAAVGSRYLKEGSDGRLPGANLALRLQVALTAQLSRLTRRLLGGNFFDWTSGFIAIRRDILPIAAISGDHGEYFIALISSLLAARRRVIEVPYVLEPRHSGASKTAETVWGILKRGPKYLAALAREALKCGAEKETASLEAQKRA